MNGRIGSGKIRRSETGHHSARHRDAGDGRTGNSAGAAENRYPRSDHHVQHADGARGLDHPGGPRSRRYGLRGQAEQRQRSGDVRNHHERIDPEDPCICAGYRAAASSFRESSSLLPPALLSTRPRLLSPVHVVVIGVSTGGPDALARLLPTLPAEFPVPLLIAQHMPAIFTSMLAARLSAKSALPVRECVSGEPLRAGCALIAPGDFHMVVRQENGTPRVSTHQGPRENFCRPSVDVLFRSVAEVYGARTLAVILTGMGHDGLRGCEMLRESRSANLCAGRSEQRSLGHAGICRESRSRRQDSSASADWCGDCARNDSASRRTNAILRSRFLDVRIKSWSRLSR